MLVQGIAFWVLAVVTVGAGLAVITARNPVHSVLFLITAFFSSAGLFVLMGAEFLAMILVVVYVGAVAVLFLFVVMMLDVDFADLRRGSFRYLPIGLTVAGVLTVEMILVATSVATGGAAGQFTAPDSLGTRTAGAAGSVTNAEAIGRVLYTDYVYVFQAAGVVLLIAMIGAIVLTLKHRVGVKRQDVGAQTARTVATGLRIVSIKSGEGIDA